MKVLLDTNVILDIVLERQPFVEAAVNLLRTSQRDDRLRFFVTATTITDLYYITRKAKGRVVALNFIADLLQVIDVAGVDKAVIMQALQSEIVDFEDAIQESAAIQQSIDILVTRNTVDFQNAVLKVHTPESFLRHL